MNVTIYEGFNKNRGDFPLLAILNGIRDGRWSKTVVAIREALQAGDNEKADRMKKGLPAFTFSANYTGSRKKDSMSHYTGLIMLDIDKLDADQIDPVIWVASDSPYTLFCFRSPSGCGVKIGVDPLAIGALPLVGHPLTVVNHKETFKACAAYYETLINVPVDPSGKDPGRLCFVSYSPDMYMNTDALRQASERKTGLAETKTVAEATPEKSAPKKAKKNEKPAAGSLPQDACSTLSALKRIRTRTNASGRYAEGNRNNYIYRFACMCGEENVPKEEAIAYCRSRFKGLPETELIATVESGYRTALENSSGEKQEATNGRDKKLVAQTEQWLLSHYHFRYNIVSRVVECKRRNSKTPYQPLNDQTENSIWRALQHDGIPIKILMLHTILLSDFSKDYDPFKDYFNALPAWDGTTDYIRQLAETVEVENAELWYRALRRFLVAMVASALHRNVVNHTVLVLASDQGKGKTTWCLNLIPPELHAYRYSGIPDPRHKDTATIIARCMLVNLDELGMLPMRELNPLKEMITKSVIHMRPTYGRNMEHFQRIASFTGSVNSIQVFSDQSGSRRFACFEARRIDYLSPVNYTGVYSQVMALLGDDFRYWLDDDEIEEMNKNNETFRIRTPEEEIFRTWVRKPKEGDTGIEYLTSAQILAFLCHKVPLQMSHSALTCIGMILKKDGFEHFFRHNKRIYAVVFNTLDEVNAEKKSVGKESSKDHQDNDNEKYMF